MHEEEEKTLELELLPTHKTMGGEWENSDDSDDEDVFYEHHRVVVDGKQKAMRIDKFLMDRIERVTRSKLQNALHAGAIRVDGREVKPNYKIKPNEVITIVLTKPPSSGGLKPEAMSLDIIYEDNELLVLQKPPGMVVHPGVGNHFGTLVNGLAYHFEQMPVMEGNRPDRPGLVHRIDKDTSGLLVIAKTEVAMAHLAKQFFDHSIERTYQAIVWGCPDPPEGTITANVGRHPTQRLLQYVFANPEEGRHAVTHYRVMEDLGYISLVECKLETGRTHQIRIHLKHLGHTLFNDKLYDGNRILKGTIYSKYKQFVANCFAILPRQALHAKTLGFIHPTTGEKMHFDTPLPDDMKAALEKWRIYMHGRRTGAEE